MRSIREIESVFDAASDLASDYILRLSEVCCAADVPDQALYSFAMSIASNAMLHFRDLASSEGATLPELPSLPAVEPARA